MAITAAEQLGVPVGHIEVETGDTRLPPAPVAGGSNSTASVCNAVAKACEQIRDRLARAAVADVHSAFWGADPAVLWLEEGRLRGPQSEETLQQASARLGQGAVEAYIENTPPEVKPEAASKL